MTEQLKPCPFCGSTNIKVHSYSDAVIGGEPDAFAQCHDCSVTGPNGTTDAEAAEAWNTRAPSSQQIGATAEYWGNLAQQKADADAKRGVSMPVSYYASTVVGALLTANPALTTSQPAQAGEVGEPNAKLMELADRIDHEQLWRLSGLDQMVLPQEKQNRILAGVMLRRYADLLGNDGWRVFPPRPGVSFRASTLDKVVEIARRDEARRASLPTQPAAQATPAAEATDEHRSFMQQFDDARANIAAISQAMERSTPQQATQQAAGEPVGERATVPLDALHAVERERDYWRTRARAMLDHAEGTCWYWMGDGEDHLESLVNSLPVVIRADQLRELLAHPAPGVPKVWTDEQCLEFMCVALRHVEYKRGTKGPTCDDVRLGVARALAAAQAKGGEQ